MKFAVFQYPVFQYPEQSSRNHDSGYVFVINCYMNMDIEIPPMRGGSTNSIGCGAETSDPMMLVSGSLERGNTYLSNKKK